MKVLFAAPRKVRLTLIVSVFFLFCFCAGCLVNVANVRMNVIVVHSTPTELLFLSFAGTSIVGYFSNLCLSVL